MHKLLIKNCLKAGFSPNIVLETNDAQCYLTAIREGVGIGPVREYSHFNGAERRYLNVTDFDEHQTFFCYYKRQNKTPPLQEFINFLKNISF